MQQGSSQMQPLCLGCIPQLCLKARHVACQTCQSKCMCRKSCIFLPCPLAAAGMRPQACAAAPISPSALLGGDEQRSAHATSLSSTIVGLHSLTAFRLQWACRSMQRQPHDVQDFMGFLHLGWDMAAREESAAELAAGRAEAQLPAWQAVACCTDLTRPGMTTVRRIMGWAPLHVAAMEDQPAVVRKLVCELGADPHQRSANSWTALHCAAAHNKVPVLWSASCP